MIPYKTIFKALFDNDIKYLIAGGFAVNFHQVQRATVDLDLIVLLEKQNVLKFVKAVEELGFMPKVPVNAAELADPEKRKEWIEEKGMMVFSFYNKNNPLEILDVFVDPPKDFSEMWQSRLIVSAFGQQLNVVGKQDLIEMKLKAGRDKDLYDIQELKKGS